MHTQILTHKHHTKKHCTTTQRIKHSHSGYTDTHSRRYPNKNITRRKYHTTPHKSEYSQHIYTDTHTHEGKHTPIFHTGKGNTLKSNTCKWYSRTHTLHHKPAKTQHTRTNNKPKTWYTITHAVYLVLECRRKCCNHVRTSVGREKVDDNHLKSPTQLTMQATNQRPSFALLLWFTTNQRVSLYVKVKCFGEYEEKECRTFDVAALSQNTTHITRTLWDKSRWSAMLWTLLITHVYRHSVGAMLWGVIVVIWVACNVVCVRDSYLWHRVATTFLWCVDTMRMWERGPQSSVLLLLLRVRGWDTGIGSWERIC